MAGQYHEPYEALSKKTKEIHRAYVSLIEERRHCLKATALDQGTMKLSALSTQRMTTSGR